jgi:hypothetical protein
LLTPFKVDRIGKGGGRKGRTICGNKNRAKYFLQMITQFDGFHWGKIQPSESNNEGLSRGR